MNRANTERKSELYQRCDEVLHYLWDPIGVVGIPEARDEYEAYVPSVCGLLENGETEQAIAEYLTSVEREAIGLGAGTVRAAEAAGVLLGWWERLGDPLRMSEDDFWLRLEFRLCHEFDGFEACRKRGLWCDGVYPQVYDLDSEPQAIEGQAWIGLGPRDQEQWSFRLILPLEVRDRSTIEWIRVLPAPDVTGWLTVDREGKELILEPGVAIPDGD